MAFDLLLKLEQKVEHAVEVIELLRLQIEELEEENSALKAEQEKWRDELLSLIGRFDQIEISPEMAFHKKGTPRHVEEDTSVEEESFIE